MPASGPSTRTTALVDYVRAAVRADPTAKVLIFSQWTSFLDLVESALRTMLRAELPGFTYCRLDGDVREAAKRDGVVRNFSASARCCAMLASLHSVGVGLNLTCANHVVMLDEWWNPALGAQAEDRVHRIGQRRPVSIVRIVCDAAIDVAVRRIQAAKRSRALQCIEGVERDCEADFGIPPSPAPLHPCPPSATPACPGGGRSLSESDLAVVFSDIIRLRPRIVGGSSPVPPTPAEALSPPFSPPSDERPDFSERSDTEPNEEEHASASAECVHSHPVHRHAASQKWQNSKME